MAKILRTEQLSVDGDNIRLTADQGNLIINSVSGDDLTQITSTTKIGQDISSLAVRDTGFDTDVSSLAAKNSEAEELAVTASKYGAYGLKTSNLSTGSGSSVQTITLSGRAFISEPVVTASLIGSENDPIIAVMVSDVSETATSGVYQATFQFSDELPATGETDQATSYKLNIVACVSGTDADLDTIIDDMDSDRDGDGVENSLDYNPDDPSVTSDPKPTSLYNVTEVFDRGSGAYKYSDTSYTRSYKGALLSQGLDIYNYLYSLSHTSTNSNTPINWANTLNFKLDNPIQFDIYNTSETFVKTVYIGSFHRNSPNNNIVLIKFSDSSGNNTTEVMASGYYVKVK